MDVVDWYCARYGALQHANMQYHLDNMLGLKEVKDYVATNRSFRKF